VASFVFDLASHLSGEPTVFAKGAFWLIGLGLRCEGCRIGRPADRRSGRRMGQQPSKEVG
jgi:hypothetical protein